MNNLLNELKGLTDSCVAKNLDPLFVDVVTAEEEELGEAATATATKATQTDDKTIMNEEDGLIILTSITKKVSDKDTILYNK